MAKDRWIDLPLFPLNTVLFPGMVLPLHIFEERYKLMVRRCLEEEISFGVVLIREGQEAGGDAVPYEVGTSAVIAGVTRLADGRMDIATVGRERFRLLGVRRDLPYLVGSAVPWPLTGSEAENSSHRAESVRALFTQYLRLLEQTEGREIEIEELPTEPKSLALLVAIALQVRMSEKQNLLNKPTVVEMLKSEQNILRRENLLLHHILHTQTGQWEGGFSGYLAKN